MNGIKNNILRIAVISVLSSSFISTSSVYAEIPENAMRMGNMDKQNIIKAALLSKYSSVIKLDGLKYTVKNIYRTNSNGVKKATNGRTFICVEMDIKNNNSYNTQITSVMNFSLTDTLGNWFNVVMPEGKDSLNGQLASGVTKSGKVYFDADINTTNFILTFRSRMSGDKSITISADGKIINNSTENNNDNNNQEKYERGYELNQTVNCDYLTFNMGDIKVSNYYNGNFAKKGFKFVYIDVEVQNTGNHQDQITSSFMFEMKDENSNYYRIKLPEENGINSIINPNQKLSGKIVFEVDEDSSSFKVRIKPWTYKNYQAFIKFDAI